MKIALGPVLYHWPRAQLDAFYRDVAAMPVDIVYLGEVVCSKRREYRFDDWLDAAQRLAEHGKQVVLSAQALMESEADLRTLRRIAANGRFAVEANDMGAVHLLAGQRFVAGPHLNVYNRTTLEVLSSLGAMRWVPPVEITRETLAGTLAPPRAGLELEMFAVGRMPLAFSARCFTARHHDRAKDDCAFACIDDHDGLELRTRDDEPFLMLNGIQTQSYRVLNLIDSLAELQALGTAVVRISPQSKRTAEVAAIVRRALDGTLAARAAAVAMAPLLPAPMCNGYFHGRPGLASVASAAEASTRGSETSR